MHPAPQSIHHDCVHLRPDSGFKRAHVSAVVAHFVAVDGPKRTALIGEPLQVSLCERCAAYVLGIVSSLAPWLPDE